MKSWTWLWLSLARVVTTSLVKALSAWSFVSGRGWPAHRAETTSSGTPDILATMLWTAMQ